MSKDAKVQKRLVLVDGSSYLFRAYHALPPLTTSGGIPTGAAYGVLNMLKKLINEEQPDYIGVIFDTKGKNFRHELYPEYKANRPEMPEELAVQIAPLHDTIRALGFPLLAIEGVEADDVIATLAHRASQENIQTLISTGDKDLAQLVDSNTVLINTMTGVSLDEQGVLNKFGVRPNQIIDYLTLMGDPVDNVPGIPKVGPKTAVKWLAQYETLDAIMAHADEFKGKVGENLRAHLDKLPLGKELVTVKRELPLDVSWEGLIAQAPDPEKLAALYQKMEFKTWLKELGEESSAPAATQKKGEYQTIQDKDTLLSVLDKVCSAKKVSIDTETTSIDAMQASIVGFSMAYEENKAYYVPLTHKTTEATPQLELEWVIAQLKPVLEDESIQKIGQHLKYDMHVFSHMGIKLNRVNEDTMLASYVLNSTATRHDMDSLALHYLNVKTIPYVDVAGKGAKQITFDEVAIDVATEYAAEDADITLRLSNVLNEKLRATPDLLKVYQEIELPLVEVLWQMEEQGIALDAKKLEKQSEQIEKTLAGLEEKAHVLAGESFNLSSVKQLQAIFYDKLDLPILERTPKGAPSTAESVLQELSHDYELPAIILSYRTLSKLKSTYTDKLPLQVNPRTKRIHTSYHQATAATGRLSSSDPNLQNIPIRTEEGRKIRQAFIPEAGYQLVSADYSQIELRIMAHLSQDERLLQAFRDGEDIHRFTASEIFQAPLEKVSAEQRRSAKAINFGLIYGMSAFGLARQLGIDRSSANDYMEQYFARYPGVKQYMENIREQASKTGYVETIFKRRLYLPDIRSKNVPRRKAAERTAINAPMQGTAADIIKKAMIAIHHRIHDDNDIKMLMQVHDELVFEVKEQKLTQAKALIQDLMENTVTLSVPLSVSVGVGHNWDEAH